MVSTAAVAKIKSPKRKQVQRMMVANDCSRRVAHGPTRLKPAQTEGAIFSPSHRPILREATQGAKPLRGHGEIAAGKEMSPALRRIVIFIGAIQDKVERLGINIGVERVRQFS